MNKVQHSEDIKAGLRRGFQEGTSKLAQRRCYGYEVSSEGELSDDLFQAVQEERLRRSRNLEKTLAMNMTF